MSSRSHAVRRLASVQSLWSDREFSTSNFLPEHGQHIPVLICISEGYNGADDFHSVSVEDVRNVTQASTVWLALANEEVAWA